MSVLVSLCLLKIELVADGSCNRSRHQSLNMLDPDSESAAGAATALGDDGKKDAR